MPRPRFHFRPPLSGRTLSRPSPAGAGFAPGTGQHRAASPLIPAFPQTGRLRGLHGTAGSAGRTKGPMDVSLWLSDPDFSSC